MRQNTPQNESTTFRTNTRRAVSLTCGMLAGTLAFDAAALFDFEMPEFALGSTYGAPAGHVPGQVVFGNSIARASVEEFKLGTFVGFNFSEIARPPTSMFPPAINSSQVLNINNISMRYDFGGSTLPVQRVVFDYVDRGGDENFEINSTGLQEVPHLAAVVAPAGFAVNVSVNPIGGGSYGRVEVLARPGENIRSITVGGQEFAMDNLLKEVRPRADFNMDGSVDLLDLDILGANWGKEDPKFAEGDSNCDGKIDLLDLDVLGEQWGSGSNAFAAALSSSGFAVPEPASLILAGAGGLMVLRRRRG